MIQRAARAWLQARREQRASRVLGRCAVKLLTRAARARAEMVREVEREHRAQAHRAKQAAAKSKTEKIKSALKRENMMSSRQAVDAHCDVKKMKQLSADEEIVAVLMSVVRPVTCRLIHDPARPMTCRLIHDPAHPMRHHAAR